MRLVYALQFRVEDSARPGESSLPDLLKGEVTAWIGDWYSGDWVSTFYSQIPVRRLRRSPCTQSTWPTAFRTRMGLLTTR